LLAGVDHVLKMGEADPERLGIGGWSYGGILTDYTIAQDTRFKAAISGAGSANQIAMYGTDQYTFQYDNEIGPTWKNPEAWVKNPILSSKPTALRLRHCLWEVIKTSTSRSPAANRCTRHSSHLKFPPNWSFIPVNFTALPAPALLRTYERYLAWYDKYVKANGTPLTAAR